LTADLKFKNQFLLAMPGLAGTYFGDTLTYICEHNEDGAMGIMVNRPSSISLIELLAQLGIDKGATPTDAVVMEGGPSAPNGDSSSTATTWRSRLRSPSATG
jgi:putative transcriptional regulator